MKTLATETMARPKDRRERILVAASELMADRGFAATSVQDIGERTGITGGAIYRHFPSKDAILQTLLLDTIEMWVVTSEAARARAVESGRPPLEVLMESALQFVIDRRGRVATYLREHHRADAESIKDELHRQEVELARYWFRAIMERQPTLTRTDVATRMQAVFGVLASLARKPSVLASAPSRSLVSYALVAVASAPSIAQPPSRPPASSSWSAPVTKRHQILDSAMELFARRGFHGAGLNELGEMLGIAGPSIYEHFAAKSDILLDAFDQAGALVVAGAMTALSNGTSASTTLDGLLTSFVGVCFTHVNLISVTTREGSSLPAEDKPRLARRRRDLHEMWISILREVRPVSAHEARILVRTSMSLIQQLARMPAATRPTPHTAATLARIFLTADGSN